MDQEGRGQHTAQAGVKANLWHNSTQQERQENRALFSRLGGFGGTECLVLPCRFALLRLKAQGKATHVQRWVAHRQLTIRMNMHQKTG